MREAQVNYRKFFVAENLDLLPRILERFNAREQKPQTAIELMQRVSTVRQRVTEMEHFGLETDDADLNTLANLLKGDSDVVKDPHSLAVLETYVEMQENRQNARDLVATRLLEFERIMDEFLLGKSVRINKSGLQILANGEALPETSLSSGEYHLGC